MATAVFRAPTGAPIMSNIKPLKPELAEIVRQIRALKTVTRKTGFITNRTVGEMLKQLSKDDLVAVGEALQLHPQDLKHYLR
jgi:hypothetical protein